MPETKHKKLRNMLPALPEKTFEFSEFLLSIKLDYADCDLSGYNSNLSGMDCSLQAKLVSSILNIIPEWERLINCRQHPTHDFDLGTHTLLVIKKMQQTQEYELFNDYNKLLILFTALLHDIEKVEKEVDPEHPVKGAQKASAILYRLGFDDEFINDVYSLIKNHQLLGLIASGRIFLSTKDIADMLKNPELINLLALLAVADIKSVKENEAFFSSKIGSNIESIRCNVNVYFKENYKNR